MENDEIIKYPWQRTPTALISFARELIQKDSTFNQQLAFLLLDVGIETLFTVFLLLPKEVTGTEMSYGKRKSFTEKGSFHELILGVKEAAEKRLEGVDLNQVQYYHNIRNKLYHAGDGITPTIENAGNYEKLAIILLKKLLGVDLDADETDRPYAFEQALNNIDREFRVSDLIRDVEKSLNELRIYSAATVGRIKPEWAKRSFEKRLVEIWSSYPDLEIDAPWVRTENQNMRISLFNELIGKDIQDYWLVDKVLQDITYLHLALLTQKIDREVYKELEIYETACDFIYKPHPSMADDIETEEAESGEIISWVDKLLEEIEVIV